MQYFQKSLVLTTTFGLLVSGCSFSKAKPKKKSAEKASVAPKIVQQDKADKIYEETIVDHGRTYSVKIYNESHGKHRRIRLETEGSDIHLEKEEQLKIGSEDFHIQVPLGTEDYSVDVMRASKASQEKSIHEHFRKILSEYIQPERFNMVTKVSWNQSLLERFQVTNSGLYSLSNSEKATFRLADAIEMITIEVVLDQSLPAYHNEFTKEILENQPYFVKKRGDNVQISRTPFPQKQSVSSAPFEEQRIIDKVTRFVRTYINADDFLINVTFNKEKLSKNGTMPVEVHLTLNDTVQPETDVFLMKTLGLEIPLVNSRGDQLHITRKRFPRPEVSLEQSTQEQEAFRKFKQEIVEKFEAGNYADSLVLINQALLIRTNRSEKIELLKMKGSIHFLRQERHLAKETLEYVLSLNPEDLQVQETLGLLQ